MPSATVTDYYYYFLFALLLLARSYTAHLHSVDRIPSSTFHLPLSTFNFMHPAPAPPTRRPTPLARSAPALGYVPRPYPDHGLRPT